MNGYHRNGRETGRLTAVRRVAAVLLIALLAAPQLLMAAASGPELPDPGTVPGVTKEQQRQIGRKVVNEVYKQMPVLPDSSPVTQYVRDLGRRLERVIPPEYGWPYEFHVVQQKDINAFALPGGPIFVNLGTITAASNESELAGVIAHEMAHVYMQHSIKQQRKAALPSLLGGLASAAGAVVGGPVGALGQIGAQVVAGSIIMKYSRGDESQADAVGAIIMYKAGYNPQAMADFFQKLEKQSGGGSGPQFLSSHPNPGNRYAAITKEIQNWPARQWTTDTAQFRDARVAAGQARAYSAQEIQQRAKAGGGWNNQRPEPQNTSSSSSDYPADARDSRTGRDRSDRSDRRDAGSEPPPMDRVSLEASPNMRSLRGQGFTMQYPDNWRPVKGSQSGVTIALEGGLSENAIAYGVMVDVFAPASRGSLSQQTQELIGSIREQNPGLRAVGSPQRITVNGAQGQSIDLLGSSPVQDDRGPLAERDWLVTVQRPDGALLYLIFIAPDRDFTQLRPTFETMLRSVRVQ